MKFENSTHELTIDDASKSQLEILQYLEIFVHVEIGSKLVRSGYSNSNRTVLWGQIYLASMHSEYIKETKLVAKDS